MNLDEIFTPQAVMGAMMVLSLFGGIVTSGQTYTRNGWASAVDFLCVAIVLYWGGFWHD
jgi:hypothetical protein